MKYAQTLKADYDEKLKAISDSLSFESYDIIADVKGMPRALEKAAEKVEKARIKAKRNNKAFDEVAERKKAINRLSDLLRGSILVDNPNDVAAANAAIIRMFAPGSALVDGTEENGVYSNKNITVEIEDRFVNPTPAGYSDVQMKVEIEEGFFAEVQVHIPEMFVAKEGWFPGIPEKYKAEKLGVPNGLGHKLFEKYRSLPEDDPERTILEEQMRELYKTAIESSQRRLSSTNRSQVNGPRVSAASAQGREPKSGITSPTLDAYPNTLPPSTTTGTPSSVQNVASGENGFFGSSSFIHSYNTPDSEKRKQVSITKANIEEYRGNVDVSALAEYKDAFGRAFAITGKDLQSRKVLMVPIESLVSHKNELQDPKFLAGKKKDPRQNAADWMVKAIEKVEGAKKRDPLDVVENGDGTYRIEDGNATAQAAMLAGWTRLPIRIVEPPSLKANKELWDLTKKNETEEERAGRLGNAIRAPREWVNPHKSDGAFRSGWKITRAGRILKDAQGNRFVTESVDTGDDKVTIRDARGKTFTMGLKDAQKKYMVELTADEIALEPLLIERLKYAQTLKADYDQKLKAISDSLSFESYDIIADVKGMPRALEKAAEKVGKARKDAKEEGLVFNEVAERENVINSLSDLVRGSILVDNPNDVAAANAAIIRMFAPGSALVDGTEENGVYSNKNITVEIEDRFVNPTPAGYSDVQMKVEIEGGFFAEVQVHIPEMFVAKEGWFPGIPEKYKAGELGVPNGLGHKLFEKYRSLPKDDPERTILEEQMRELYKTAIEASQRRLAFIKSSQDNGPRVSAASGQGTFQSTSYGFPLARENENVLPPSTTTGTPSSVQNVAFGENGFFGSSSFIHSYNTPDSEKRKQVSITKANIEEYRGNVDVSALAEYKDAFGRAFAITGKDLQSRKVLMVPIESLVSHKNELQDPKFLAGKKKDPRQNAADWMVKAIEKVEGAKKRDPLDVVENGDGTYRIEDGNATAQAAMLAGWTRLPIRIVEPPSLKANKRPSNQQLNLFDLLSVDQQQEKQQQELDLFGGVPQQENIDLFGAPIVSDDKPQKRKVPNDRLRRDNELSREPRNRRDNKTGEQPGIFGEDAPEDLFSSGSGFGAGQPGSVRSGDGGQQPVRPSGREDLQRPQEESRSVEDVQGSGREGESGQRDGGVSRRVRNRRLRLARPEQGDLGRNHVIESGDTIAPRGAVTRLKTNIEAIKLLKALESENRNATVDEKKLLAQYVGWGGLSQVFDDLKAHEFARKDHETLRNRVKSYENIPMYAKYVEGLLKDSRAIENWGEKWGKWNSELKELLTPEEYRMAAASTTNSHYTSAELIKAMWSMVEKMGFTGGRILEPAGGVGYFFGLMPENIADGSQFSGVELDSLSGRMFGKLYPEANIQVTGFQDAKIADNSIDLAISNVPFANVSIYDAGLEAVGAPKFSLHNYFFAKALQKVRPGGLLAFITTSNTMDSNIQQRRWIAEHGDLVAAVRLPNTAFNEIANTEVVTDVLFIRKPDGSNFSNKNNWSLTAPVKTTDGQEVHRRTPRTRVPFSRRS